MKTPKKYTKPGHIYSGDNGRLTCSLCSGGSLTFTGRDLSGQRAHKMTKEDNTEWISYFKRPMACECGKTRYDEQGNCTTDPNRSPIQYGILTPPVSLAAFHEGKDCRTPTQRACGDLKAALKG